MKTITLNMLSFVGLVLGMMTTSFATTLCIDTAGHVRSAAQCAGGEQTVVLDGATTSSASQTKSGLSNVNPTHVWDANGNDLGMLMGAPWGQWVSVLDVDNQRYSNLTVDPYAPQNFITDTFSQGNLVYLTDDCSGDPKVVATLSISTPTVPNDLWYFNNWNLRDAIPYAYPTIYSLTYSNAQNQMVEYSPRQYRALGELVAKTTNTTTVTKTIYDPAIRSVRGTLQRNPIGTWPDYYIKPDDGCTRLTEWSDPGVSKGPRYALWTTFTRFNRLEPGYTRFVFGIRETTSTLPDHIVGPLSYH